MILHLIASQCVHSKQHLNALLSYLPDFVAYAGLAQALSNALLTQALWAGYGWHRSPPLNKYLIWVSLPISGRSLMAVSCPVVVAVAGMAHCTVVDKRAVLPHGLRPKPPKL